MSSAYISLLGHTQEHFQLKIRDCVKRRFLMFSAMTSGSNHTVVITRTGVERDCCTSCRQQKARSDNFGYFSHSKPKDPHHPKSHCYRTRVKLCFKDKVRMEQKEQTGDPNSEATNGGKLRELASKWFIDTQVPLIVSNGLFPSWFMGFISRKDAENLLKDKELGCYLIRLSDKAIGYILSYKGRDRFRHFVISQSETGQFVVSGDNEGHDTVLKLIEHYKAIPIEPFGEYLTFPCFKDHSEDLYDIIRVSPKDKPEAVLRAAKNVQKQKTTSAPDHQPAWQSKSNKTEEEVPPLPRRSRHLDSGTFTDEQDRVVYAQLKKQTVKEKPRTQHVQQDNLPEVSRRKAERSNGKNKSNGRCSPPSVPESVYTELNPLDSKSKSLPLLDSSSDSEQSYRLRVPPDTPPRLSPKPVRQAASYVPQSNSSRSLDGMSDNAVYHLAGPASFNNRSSTAEQQSNSLYAEVAIETPVLNQDDTYELIPDHKEPAKPNSSYEPVEDKRKYNNSSWGIKNDKWKWLFPEAKRKW